MPKTPAKVLNEVTHVSRSKQKDAVLLSSARGMKIRYHDRKSIIVKIYKAKILYVPRLVRTSP